MPIFAGTADKLNKFQSIARAVALSQNLASADTFTIAHQLTNAGGKGISYYQFKALVRSITTASIGRAQVHLDSWNGSLATFRLNDASCAALVADIVCEDPHSITW